MNPSRPFGFRNKQQQQYRWVLKIRTDSFQIALPCITNSIVAMDMEMTSLRYAKFRALETYRIKSISVEFRKITTTILQQINHRFFLVFKIWVSLSLFCITVTNKILGD